MSVFALRPAATVTEPVKTHGIGKAALPPPLKWAGGKRWLVPVLNKMWKPHSHRRLVEPFVGGLSISLGLRPERALLNDINPHAINFYVHLQRGLRIGIEMENDRDVFYESRDRFNYLIESGKADGEEAASLFYYLNRTGYNGLCRFNSKGRFNVPFGRYKRINYATDFANYKSVLSRWDFRNKSFEVLFADDIRPDDFIYADPPYDVEFTRYSKEDFTWDMQEMLAELLSKHPSPAIASNQATERILRLYHGLGFKVKIIDGPRRIACNGDRSPAPEILAVKGM